MKVNVILADVGSREAGKLNLLGAGWSAASLGSNGMIADCAVAVFVEVPGDQCGSEIEFTIELQDDAGEVVALPAETGSTAVRISHRATVAVASGVPTGSPGTYNFLARFQDGLPLLPAAWYRWSVSVAGESDETWAARFYVRPQPGGPES